MPVERGYDPESLNGSQADGGQGGFVALAVISAALGAGAAILLAPAEGARTRQRVTQGLRAIGGEAAGDVRRTRADVSKAERELGWAPTTSLADGLAAQWEWVAARVAAA